MRRLACWVTPVYNAETSSGSGSVTALGRAFDSWLERKLHEMYDEVALEPLPPDLLSLVNQLDKSDDADTKK